MFAGKLREPTDCCLAAGAYGRFATMHQTQQLRPLAAARAQFARSKPLIVGLLVLYLIGAGFIVLVTRDQTPNAPAKKVYPPDLVYGVLAYDLTDPAPTSYGSFVADAVHLDNSGSPTEVDITLSVENQKDAAVDLPALDQLRVVNTDGAEATYLGGNWRGDSVLRARASASGEFRFAAPPAGGMLILEYREPNSQAPIRVSVGYALEHSDAPAAISANTP
jgi:hypothetical protein